MAPLCSASELIHSHCTLKLKLIFFLKNQEKFCFFLIIILKNQEKFSFFLIIILTNQEKFSFFFLLLFRKTRKHLVFFFEKLVQLSDFTRTIYMNMNNIF